MNVVLFVPRALCSLTVLLRGMDELQKTGPAFASGGGFFGNTYSYAYQRLARKVRRTRWIFYPSAAALLISWTVVASNLLNQSHVSNKVLIAGCIIGVASSRLTVLLLTPMSLQRKQAAALWYAALWATVPGLEAETLCMPAVFNAVGRSWLEAHAIDIEEFFAIGEHSREPVAAIAEATQLLSIAA